MIRTATETRQDNNGGEMDIKKIGMADKVGSEDSGGQVWWGRCGKPGMDTAAEEM